MSSVASDDDLTARARIRNVAVGHFAREGFERANLRKIAAEAGVSVGLIFHHFGSKEGLRKACDDHFLEAMITQARSAGRPSGAGLPALLGTYLADPGEYRLKALYLARVINDDTQAATAIVDAMVAESEAIVQANAEGGSMRESADPRALAVLMVLISQAIFTMPPALARSLGAELFGPDVLRRLTGPILELFTRGIYTDEAIQRAAGDAWEAKDQDRKDRNR